ncbi:MAG: hypothetical protein E6H58_05315 [Betaproteobacteria bacterium]|nr:MAG: hypothetical protein E6H58_05315 [Betaproteobacteria bacterium]
MDAQAWGIVVGVVILALIAIAALLVYQKRQSHRLEQRFGPEYRRAVNDLGSKTKAESELRAREKRVEKPWKALQGRFVDNPKGVLAEADQLVRDLMLKRGYPMGDFEHRAADISVDHPAVVDHYRAAQAIAARDQRGEADTEALRQAVVHYRALFDELLEVRTPVKPQPAQPMEVRA